MWPSPAAATCTEYRRSFRYGACGSTRPAPRRACSPTPGRSAASEVRAVRLRKNEPRSELLRRSRLVWARRTLRSHHLQPFAAAVAPHRFSVPTSPRCVSRAGASPTGSPTSAPTNVGDTSPPTRLVDPCIYARDGECDVPSRCPVGDWEDCSTAGTQPSIRRPTFRLRSAM